ncbi:MAG: Gfo/Idh/MocA family oxidoreductase [Candidatus Solibacter usitatus]|nr:Gfo/Idh/MocA family oxidoreductase [Candidatus Solibacter usitatus]
MPSASRRDFLRQAALTAPAIQAGFAQRSPNDTVRVAVVGFHGRGKAHYRAFAKMPNVRVAALCDADERLFPEAVAEVEKLAGHRPDTEYDIRRLLERKDIDAVSIATPDYWHALMTVWACQAGKDVYVEKPVSFTILEGRRMVEASRKYQRIVQAGLNMRSEPEARAAVRLLHQGQLGQVYRGKVMITKPRGSIGRVQESSIPEGVHWDLFLGPSRYRPYTANRLHYGWHFFWDTSTTDIGNTGVHHLDLARWGMNKRVHPVKVHSAGGYYVWNSEQETPNFQVATLEYADGAIMDVELSNLYAPPSPVFNLFYTSEGYLSCGDEWKAMKGVFQPRGPETSPTEHATVASFPRASYVPGPPIDPASEKSVNHFENFIACVRSRKREDLYCDILEGHLSTTLCHMANISYRTGRKLVFDPDQERFVGDDEANRYLTREYRKPYTLPDKV